MKKNKDSELKQYGWFMTKIYLLIVLFSKNTYVLDVFRERIRPSAKVLEIGSGPGKDYRILSKKYDIDGSDYSDSFLRYLHKKFKGDHFYKLNALTMEIDKKYDVIFSNKVLQHFKPEELRISLLNQYDVLNEGGYLFHAIWKGDTGAAKDKALPDVAYSRRDFEEMKGDLIIEDYIEYKEFNDEDSFIIILRKKESS